MAPKYKLTYFNFKALAEPIRMLFHYANVEFEDVPLEREDWPNLKPQMPWNVIPVLEEDEKVLAQSLTILQYLGRKFGVASKDEWSIAKGNEYIDAVSDVRQEVTKAFREKDETRKAEIKKNLKEVVLPRLLKKLDDILKQNGTGVLVGKDVTYADIYVSFMTEFLTKFVEFDVNEYSNVVGLHQKINNSEGIKQWIQVRPDTPWNGIRI